jgi:membrane protein YdbS with pleckstrin-like domain
MSIKRLTIINIFLSILYVIFIGIGFTLYHNERQLSPESSICFIMALLIMIIDLPLYMKIWRMKQQHKEQTPDTTNKDFTSLGKKSIFVRKARIYVFRQIICMLGLMPNISKSFVFCFILNTITSYKPSQFN